MALLCSSSTLPVPDLFGGKVLAFNVDLVRNYTAASPSEVYYGHPSVQAEVSFCNVTVTYTHPGQDDTVTVETWLPIDNFNGRLQAIGGSGWVAGRGAVSLMAMSGALAEGYATTTTDAGLPTDADAGLDQWALLSQGNPNLYMLNNLASVSLNDQATIAKQLISDFYGRPPSYSYWSGCSQGGRQGMMLAQRYPEAYDGIHAAAPAIFWNQMLLPTFWPQFVMHVMDHFPIPCEIDALTTEAVQACDGLDGVVDGIISDEAACDFNPMSVVGKPFFCADTNKTDTISAQTAKLVNETWAGPRTADGGFLWYGPNIGSQLTGSVAPLSFDIGPAMTQCAGNGTCVGVPLGLGEVWLQYFVEANTNWSFKNMTLDNFGDYAHESLQRYDSIIGTSDPDLGSFYKKGGKIISYHGMSDQIIPVKGSEHCVGMVSEKVPEINDFYRMFEVPGLLHCAGGPGGQPDNTFDALRAWVENGTAPDTLTHSYESQDGTEQQRLLCPYPKKAVFKGTMGHKSGQSHKVEDYECV